MSKTVWITGASSGIGREFARRYARLGFRLILTARRTDRLEALAAELTAKHSTFCRILPADLEQESECARLCEALADERIDIFINNAGFGVCGSFLETSGEKELSMAKVNVLAMHQLFKFAVKKMEAQGFGTVLNVASSAGLLPGGPYMAGYYATKAYVVSLTRGVAEELRQQHSPVYVCALCPGPVDTEFNERADVVFALRGISPELCVEEAMRGMLHHKTIVGPHAGGDDGPAVHADGDLNAHHGPPAEEKTGLKGHCVQQAAIPAFAESVFMTISRKRSKMRKNLQ